MLNLQCHFVHQKHPAKSDSSINDSSELVILVTQKHTVQTA